MIAAIVLLSIAVAGLLSIPRYLAYAKPPAPSDVIVMLVGPHYEDRLKEAVHLLAEGYAKCIMIPLHRQVITEKDLPSLKPEWSYEMQIDRKAFPAYYENTHLEVITAKEMMWEASLHSAIFVSSAQHMKRISIICAKVFGDDARGFSYVPTRYERKPERLNGKALAVWMNACLEVVKITWFRVYSFV